MTACGCAELYLLLKAIYPWTSHGTLEFYGKQIPFSVCVFYLSFWGHYWIPGLEIVIWKGLLSLLMLKYIFDYQRFLFRWMMGICPKLYSDLTFRACVTRHVLWPYVNTVKTGDFIFELRFLLSIHMYLNQFDKQVSLQMFSNLLANIFLAEILSKI